MIEEGIQNDIKPDTAEHDGRVKKHIQGGYGSVGCGGESPGFYFPGI